jgi:hypothetical protein
MSKLEKRKSRLLVEFSDCIRERGKSRPIVMELFPYAVRVRLKGMRQSVEVTPASIWNLGMMKFVAQKRAEKLAAKKAKKGPR